MSEETRAATAIGRLDPAWSAERAERLLPGVHRGIRRRQQQRRVATGAAIAAAVLALVWLRAPGDDSIELADGSVAAPIGASAISVVRETEADVLLLVERGAGRFDVTPSRTRTFRVKAGPVTVRVLGTAFDIAIEGEQARVTVHRGHVSVEWDGGSHELLAGEHGVFPPVEQPTDGSFVDDEEFDALLDAAYEEALAQAREEDRLAEHERLAEEEQLPEGDPAAQEGPADDEVEPSRAERHRTARRRRPARWRNYARQGAFHDAFEALRAERDTVQDSVEDLLLAADAARRSGHPREALPYLERVERSHRTDSRAALAAFTRGRLLLGLGQAREAAEVFAVSRRLAPSGVLVEDSLAREVEAAARSGQRARASRVAEEYLRRFPGGRRSAVVRRFASLD